MAVTPTRWEPLAQIERLQRELDRMFGRFEESIRSRDTQAIGAWLPEVDIEQTTDATVYRIDLPGMTADDVKVTLDDHLLTVRGERREQHEETHEGYLTRERSVGRFERSLQVPDGSVGDDVTASFADGVLTVTVPRGAQPEAREIEIGRN